MNVVDFVRGLVEAKAFPVLTAPAVVSIVGIATDVSDEKLLYAGGIAAGGQVIAAVRARFVPENQSN